MIMKKKFAIILMILGLGLICWPFAFDFYVTRKGQVAIDKIEQATKHHQLTSAQLKDLNRVAKNLRKKPQTKKVKAQIATIDHQLRSVSSTDQNNLTTNENSSKAATEYLAGSLKIDRLKLHVPFFIGASNENLARGVGLIAGTDLPGSGIGTNAVIAGHRGYYGATLFRHLDQLKSGDTIEVKYLGHHLNYRVTGRAIIDPTDQKKLAADPHQERLTLFTCHPYGFNYQRLLVFGERIA